MSADWDALAPFLTALREDNRKHDERLDERANTDQITAAMCHWLSSFGLDGHDPEVLHHLLVGCLAFVTGAHQARERGDLSYDGLGAINFMMTALARLYAALLPAEVCP